MTTQRLAFIHTVSFLAESFKKRVASQLPDASCFHILNESLLQDLLNGCEEQAVYRRVVAQIMLAVDAGAQTVVITCSSTSPAVDIARRLTRATLLKIDDPMAAKAVSLGQRIGLLCTARSTAAPSNALLHSHAAAQGRDIVVTTKVHEDAYAAIVSGSRSRHDELVLEAAADLGSSVDVLVLAQASLAHLQPLVQNQTACPVLASPDLLMNELRVRLQAK